jgi:hypothetical protein
MNANKRELRNPQVAYEAGDANTRAVVRFGVWLAVVVSLLAAGLVFYHAYLARREARRSPAPAPLAAQRPKEPPAPRLQASPRLDLREVRDAEDQALKSYGWVDPDKGIARIPIEQAMDLMVKRNAKR